MCFEGNGGFTLLRHADPYFDRMPAPVAPSKGWVEDVGDGPLKRTWAPCHVNSCAKLHGLIERVPRTWQHREKSTQSRMRSDPGIQRDARIGVTQETLVLFAGNPQLRIPACHGAGGRGPCALGDRHRHGAERQSLPAKLCPHLA